MTLKLIDTRIGTIASDSNNLKNLEKTLSFFISTALLLSLTTYAFKLINIRKEKYENSAIT